MNKSIWQVQHDAGHPDNMQGSCPICIFKKPLPPAHEVNKKVFEALDTITDDYKEKHLKEVKTK